MMTAEELIKNVLQGPSTSSERFVGLVKEDTGTPNQVLFAPGGTCENWLAVPLERILGAELIRLVSCKDHTHPLVALTLKEPEGAEAKLFASLARSTGNAVTPNPAHLFRQPSFKPPTVGNQRSLQLRPAVPGAARGRLFPHTSTEVFTIPESIATTSDGDCQVAYYGCNSCPEYGVGWCKIVYYCDGFTYTTCDKCC